MKFRYLFAATAAIFAATTIAAAGTLEDVKSRGTLRCGINGGLPGFLRA